MSKNSMNPAIIYTRLSSSNQSFNNGVYVSIENQVNKCNEYCQKLNMSVFGNVTEIKSAKNINKQYELQKILNENSNINIIFYNITRFSRNTGQAINFVNKCIEKGIKLHFTEENFTIDHYMDQHRLRLGLSQAEYESNVISNRVRSNNNVLRNKGWKFGRPRYGKKVIFKDGIRSFTINMLEKEIINFIVMSRIGDTSCSRLNRQLNKIIPKNKEPIEFWDMETEEMIDRFDKKYTLNFGEIADLLNSYKIRSRFGEWSSSKVNRIFNECFKNKLENKISSMKI